jgi:hypothetical protein
VFYLFLYWIRGSETIKSISLLHVSAWRAELCSATNFGSHGRKTSMVFGLGTLLCLVLELCFGPVQFTAGKMVQNESNRCNQMMQPSW